MRNRDDGKGEALTTKSGNANTRPGWVRGPGQNAEQRLQGQTKRLTFREGRLRLYSKNTLPDLKVRRLG